jgi:hypothetical protein
VIPGLGDGQYIVEVQHRNGKNVLVQGDTVVDLELPTSSISGTIFDGATRAAVAAAGIHALPSGRTDSAFETTTSNGGSFRIDGVTAGSYNIVVIKSGFRTTSREVQVYDQNADVSIELTPIGQRRVRVLDPFGFPMRYASADLFDSSGVHFRQPLLLDAEGVGDLPESNNYRLFVSASAFAPTFVNVDATSETPLAVRLTLGGTVRLVVTPPFIGTTATLACDSGMTVRALHLSSVTVWEHMPAGHCRLDAGDEQRSKQFALNVRERETTTLLVQ